jgi:DNA-binding NtrC family response regulator
VLELFILEGADRGACSLLDPRAAVIGSDPGCDLVLRDPESRPLHARVSTERGEVVLADLTGGEATWLNGLPLDGPASLREGDRLRCGATILIVLRASAAPRHGKTAFSGIAEPSTAYGPAHAPRRAPLAPGERAEAFLELLAGLGAALDDAPDLPQALLPILDRASTLTEMAWVELRPAGSGSPIAVGAPPVDGAGATTMALHAEGRRVGTLRLPPSDDVSASAAWRALATALAPHVARWWARFERALGAERGIDMVAVSPIMRGVVEALRRVAAKDTTVLLLGESGTGKEVAARAIHSNGRRARAPLITVNAAALTESVLESELFGHEKGAFTGAVARRLGLFELAHGGTLFLDEIGEITPSLQAKLLRVLESGEIRRVGGSETRKVDVRLIAATNRNLRAATRDGRFREDLYYRLAVVEIRLPPLRERPEDFVPLCQHLLERLARERGYSLPTIDDQALAHLRAYPFPGNIRELRNVLERSLLLGDGRRIRPADLPAELLVGHLPSPQADMPAIAPLAEVEKRHIEMVLKLTGWNKKRAAEILRVDRKTLYAKIAAYGLGPDEPR